MAFRPSISHPVSRLGNNSRKRPGRPSGSSTRFSSSSCSLSPAHTHITETSNLLYSPIAADAAVRDERFQPEHPRREHPRDYHMSTRGPKSGRAAVRVSLPPFGRVSIFLHHGHRSWSSRVHWPGNDGLTHRLGLEHSSRTQSSPASRSRTSRRQARPESAC